MHALRKYDGTQLACNPSKYLWMIPVALLCALTWMFVVVPAAQAFDVKEMLEQSIAELFQPMLISVGQFLQGCFNSILRVSDWEVLMTDAEGAETGWQTGLLGGLWSKFFVNIMETVCMPIAQQILCLVFMLRLLTITKVAEGHDMQPLVSKIAITLIGFFLAMFIISRAPDIVTLLWNFAVKMSSGISHISADLVALDKDAWANPGVVTEELVSTITRVDKMLLGLLMGLLAAILCFIVYLISLIMLYSKSITLLIYATFSPIALALVGLDQTRSWMIGFVRNLCALVLSLVICVLVMQIFPYIPAIAFGDAGGTDPGTIIGTVLHVDRIEAAGKFLVITLLLAFTMVRSSSIAKEILGA